MTKIDMPCPLCKAKDIKTAKSVSSIYSSRLYGLARCGKCGHLFLLNSPSIGELDKIYKTLYSYESHLAIKEEKRWRFLKLKTYIRKIIPRDSRIIDIGCGYGSNLEVFRELGYSKLLGIEMNPPAVKRLKENNLDVFEGTFSQWLRSGRKFSGNEHVCILLSHVVEHIQNVDSFFDEINTFLKAGDHLIILLPNPEAFTSVFFGRFWGWWQVPVHLHHFSKNSLYKLLSAKGFSVTVLFARGADSLFWLSTLASLLNIKSKSQNISKLQRLVIKFCSFISKYWIFVGKEELVVISRKIKI